METEDKIKGMLRDYERLCAENRERERVHAAAVLNEIDVEYSAVSARVERDRARLQELAALRNVTAKRLPADVQAEPAPERRVVALPAHDGEEAKFSRDKDLAYVKPVDRVLALLEKHGPLTTKQLEEASGLKVPTLRTALNRLSRTEFKIESFTLQRNESGKLHPHWRLRRAQVPQS